MTQLTQGSDMEEIKTLIASWIPIEKKDPTWLKHHKLDARDEFLAAIQADKQRSIDRAVADFASKLKVVQMVHEGSKEVFDVVLKTEIDYWLSPTTTEDKGGTR